MPNDMMHLVFALLILGYLAPWVNLLIPLTLGAYDLAEWISLYSGYPALAPALLIRLQLVFIVYYAVAMIRTTKNLQIVWIITIVLIVAQLPPLELFLGSGDFNQMQQLLLSVASVFVAVVVSKVVARHSLLNLSLLIVSIIAILTSIIGLGISITVLNLFGIYPAIGWGIVIYVAAWLLLAGNILSRLKEAG